VGPPQPPENATREALASPPALLATDDTTRRAEDAARDALTLEPPRLPLTPRESAVSQALTQALASGPLPNAPLLLSPEEAGRLLRIGRTQTFALIARGDLESVKIGRLRRVPLAACVALVERLRASGAA
jgi:excisionase family DNA binding protein